MQANVVLMIALATLLAIGGVSKLDASPLLLKEALQNELEKSAQKTKADHDAVVEMAENDPQEIARFGQLAQDYRDAKAKPTLSEEARKFKVQAEGAIRERQYGQAAELFGKALDAAPWWPEGHYNRALMLAETGNYRRAVLEMNRYLLLVPEAPDARAARDQTYEWERREEKSSPIHFFRSDLPGNPY